MTENKNIITVKNAEGDPDTTAEIVIQNKIDFEPKVSVIIPVYNVEEYLRECLDSVVNQTLKEIEIITVDDGSTDSSLEILKEYAQKDNRITVMKQANLHAGVARNAGLAVAKGEYLHFLDSDDWVEKEMLQNIVREIASCDADICVFKTDSYNNQTKEFKPMPWGFVEKYIPKKQPFSSMDIKDYIFNFCISWPWNKLFKHSFVKENNILFQALTRTNDLFFVFSALSLAKKIVTLNECLLHYRVGITTNLQSNNTKTPLDWYHACLSLKEFLFKKNLWKHFERSFVNCVVGGSQYNYNSVKNLEIKQVLHEKIKGEITQKLSINTHIQDIRYFYNFDSSNNFYKEFIRSGKQPSVTIIVPIYNTSRYLRECLDSIINQTLKDIEIICVNDGSTDDSLDIIKEYAEKDIRIRYIDKPNAGYGHTMNCGLDLASGEYIGIVEPDDFIKLNMYEVLYNKAKENNCDFVKADFQIFVGENDNRKFTYKNVSHRKDYYNKILTPIKNLDVFNTNNVTCCGIYKRDLIHNNKIRYNETPGASYQDNGFYFQTYCLANRVLFLDKDFYQIRRDNPNSSVKSITKAFVMCEEYKYIENFIKNHIKLPKNVWSIYYLKKYQNYYWRFTNVSKEIQLAFLKQFSKEMKIGLKMGYITKPVFSKTHIERIKTLANDYKEYYRLYLDQNDNTTKNRRDLIYWYKRVTQKDLDLDNPRTFNEKIQWLKLYDSTPIKTQLADKYRVREWVKEKIGEEYLIPLLGVYDAFDEIDFDKLPDKFVMKCNHGSGWNIIVPDKSKLDLQDAKSKIDRWMNDNYAFKAGCELHYRDIQPKIVIEEFLDEISNNIYDYRFFCCNGKVEQIWIDVFSGTPEHKRKIYDKNWNELNIIVKWPRLETSLPRPKNLEKMIELSEKMSKEFSLVRVDFYDINDKIYFGEMTFTSMSGIGKFEPEIEDLKLGQKIKLPKLAYNIDTGEYYTLPKNPLWKKRIKQLLSITKSYTLFPVYLIKTARMKKKIHKKVCRIIRGQLSRQFENTLLLTKHQIRDFALKNAPAPDYVKKNIKKIANDIYDKFHFRKQHRILGIKFYTKNKHKELSSLLNYTIKKIEHLEKQLKEEK